MDQKKIIALYPSVLLLILDQLSKLIIIDINPNLFFLRLSYNSGAGFSIMQGQRITLIILSILIIGVLLYYYFKHLNRNYAFALSLILGGALSNMADRILRGFVIDFIYTGLWPTFNLADSFIVIGGALLILKVYKEDSKKKNL